MSDELAAFVRAVGTVESTDDPIYLDAVEHLREDAAARVREMEQVNLSLGDGGHNLRQCLLMAAEVLTTSDSVRFLRHVAMRPESRQRATEADEQACVTLRAVTAEEALRVQAVEGLEVLARAGVPDALEALVESVDAPSLTVRAVGLAALTDVGGANRARDDAVARLAPEDRYLADLRRIDVRDVDQVADPRRHLTRPVREEAPVPRLGSNESWPIDGRPTPRIRE
jgi:hypothetical protein